MLCASASSERLRRRYANDAVGDPRAIVRAHFGMLAEERGERAVGRAVEWRDALDRGGERRELVAPRRHCPCMSAGGSTGIGRRRGRVRHGIRARDFDRDRQVGDRGFVDANRIEQHLERAAGGARHAHLDRNVVHRRREPEPRVGLAVVALPMPPLGLDFALRPCDRFLGLARERVARDAARRRQAERLVGSRLGGEKYGCHRIVSGSNAGDSSCAVAPSCSTTLPASQSKYATSRRSGPPRSTANSYGCRPVGVIRPRLSILPVPRRISAASPRACADRRDPIAIARVLEAIGGVADQEAVRAEEHRVGEIDARRQHDGRCGRRIGRTAQLSLRPPALCWPLPVAASAFAGSASSGADGDASVIAGLAGATIGGGAAALRCRASASLAAPVSLAWRSAGTAAAAASRSASPAAPVPRAPSTRLDRPQRPHRCSNSDRTSATSSAVRTRYAVFVAPSAMRVGACDAMRGHRKDDRGLRAEFGRDHRGSDPFTPVAPGASMTRARPSSTTTRPAQNQPTACGSRRCSVVEHARGERGRVVAGQDGHLGLREYRPAVDVGGDEMHGAAVTRRADRRARAGACRRPDRRAAATDGCSASGLRSAARTRRRVSA